MEKFLLKEIQQSLVGNRGTQVFVRLQEQVSATFATRLLIPQLQWRMYSSEMSKEVVGTGITIIKRP